MMSQVTIKYFAVFFFDEEAFENLFPKLIKQKNK